VEAAELLEVFQWRPAGEPFSDETLAQVKEEAADVLIYLLLFSNALDFDLVAAANEKISHNEKRFPVSEAYGIARPRDASRTDEDKL
jgi:NTP pyrophosphatase (non-canonical NTP hydrolase)